MEIRKDVAMKKGKGLAIDDRSDTFVPDYSDKSKSIAKQYEEHCEGKKPNNTKATVQ